MKIRNYKSEKGFWSALLLLFMVTMALMGLGAGSLLRSEGGNVSNRIQALQADYAANGGAYYGIQQVLQDSLTTTQVITVGVGTVTLDTADVAGSPDIILTVMASVGDVDRGIKIRITPGGGLVDKAIFTTGHVFNVSGKDSLGNDDPNLVVTQANSVPQIDEASLAAMSTAQGHDQAGNPFVPADGYPNGDFYMADGVTPNVTHVTNDLVINGGDTIYGIFVVEGNVILNGASRIDGVLYLPNVTSTVIHGGGSPSASSITGGLVSHGDIWGFGNHISVRHGPTYMREFCKYQIGPDEDTTMIYWEYI